MAERFPRLDFRRQLPKKGISGLAMFGLAFGVMAYGFSKWNRQIAKNVETEKRRTAEREALYPLLEMEKRARDRKAFLQQVHQDYEKAQRILQEERESYIAAKDAQALKPKPAEKPAAAAAKHH